MPSPPHTRYSFFLLCFHDTPLPLRFCFGAPSSLREPCQPIPLPLLLHHPFLLHLFLYLLFYFFFFEGEWGRTATTKGNQPNKATFKPTTRSNTEQPNHRDAHSRRPKLGITPNTHTNTKTKKKKKTINNKQHNKTKQNKKNAQCASKGQQRRNVVKKKNNSREGVRVTCRRR